MVLPLVDEQVLKLRCRVPSMVSDLVDSSSAGHPLEALMFGGAPAPDNLPPRAQKTFPTAALFVYFLFLAKFFF